MFFRTSVHCNPVQGQYRARTGFSLCSFHTQGKTCFHFRVPRWWKQAFPCEKNYTGKTLFSIQGWVCSVMSFQYLLSMSINIVWIERFQKFQTTKSLKSTFCFNISAVKVTQRHLLLKGSIGTLGIEDEAMATIRTIIGLAVPFFIIGPILMSFMFKWLNSSRHPCWAIIEDEVAKENHKRCCCLFSSRCSKCCETSEIIENSSPVALESTNSGNWPQAAMSLQDPSKSLNSSRRPPTHPQCTPNAPPTHPIIKSRWAPIDYVLLEPGDSSPIF